MNKLSREVPIDPARAVLLIIDVQTTVSAERSKKAPDGRALAEVAALPGSH
jgi:isochorismate hydrolase